ncbi:thiopeptide-type bacteriocin biosynthesis protein [Actinokineospora soli]
MSEDRVWRSLHVYRYGEQDAFLVDGVAPVIDGLRESGALADFFFLRYWQGGHHVRVRLLLDRAQADAAVEEATGKLAAHLAGSPVHVDFDADEFAEAAQPMMAAMEGERVQRLQPPDSILEHPYEPEYAKYGGPRGVAVAERYFGRSSAIVLDALRRTGGASSKRLGAGFSMMLRGLCAAGLSAREMADFFAHYCVVWSPYVFDEFMAAWPDLLREREAAIGAHADALLSNRDALRGDPMHDAVRQAWTAADDDVLDAVTLAGPDAPRARRAQVLLVSYLHTHNNRLGLIPEHESFLGYLGHHVLSEWAGGEASADLLRDADRYRKQRLGEYATTSGGQKTWT